MTNNQDKEKEKLKELHSIYLDLESKGLTTKSATLGDQRVSFCRGKDLLKFFNENKEDIIKKVKDALGVELNKGDNAMNSFYSTFFYNGVLIKADRFDEDAKKLYPKKLKPLPRQGIENFDEKKLYVVFIERPVQKSSIVYLTLIIVAIVSVCCIAIWPLWLKLFVWWTLFIFLCSLTGFIFLRIAVYFTFYLFGYDVWLFPYFLCEGIGILQSFRYPLLIEKREDSWWEILFRISMTVLCIAFTVYIYFYPELIYSAYEWMDYFYKEILEWGNSKITNHHNKSNSPSIVDRHDRIIKGFNDEF